MNYFIILFASVFILLFSVLSLLRSAIVLHSGTNSVDYTKVTILSGCLTLLLIVLVATKKTDQLSALSSS